ncbi:MAG TPA: VOC family protein [Verrucomicrobiae bacterium]|nr:VOC family protein [Verrucomicrobiae bacterium]
MIKDIAFTAYPAQDVRALRDWYVDALGLNFARPWEENGNLMYDEAQVGSGYFSLMTLQYIQVPAGSASGIAFEVDDLEKTVADLRTKGNTVDDPYDTPVCRVASLKDLEGNKVTLHQSKV